MYSFTLSGTKHNYLPFVNLGSNGVPFEYLYQNGNTYETASYISPAIQIGSESFSSAYVSHFIWSTYCAMKCS